MRDVNIITSLHKFKNGGTPMFTDIISKNKHDISAPDKPPRHRVSKRLWVNL